MSAPPVRTLADLDGDVLAHCAGYLGACDVASLAMACRPLRAAAYGDAVWYRLFRDQWHLRKCHVELWGSENYTNVGTLKYVK